MTFESVNALVSDLTEDQADGLVCVVCSRDDRPQVPVGRSDTGSQVFACLECTSD